jgi:calcium/calmodulin-dependent protein kinase I
MKLVHHPNIIRMETVYESRQHIFIVMELHSGGELFDRIVGRPRFSENEAFSVIYPLVESVAYLHEMGIVHRDLKVSLHAHYADSDAGVSVAWHYSFTTCI